MKFLNEKFKKSYNKRKFDEIKHFHDINKGLRETYLNINNTLDNINDWDELLNLNDEEQQLENIKVKENFQKCKCLFDFFGVIFCVLQLIIVQSNIIILNSLFNEIVEEFKLMIKKTSREYNFYERLEINSYREIPEIDVGMITSSIGIIFLKNYGYICSNISFQFSSLIYVFLLFFYFDFHTEEELLNNYTGWKLFLLIISYIFLSFLVGCSSIIALKEYYNIYSAIFVKKKNQEFIQKIFFYVFSGISAFLIILINRKIFKSFKEDKTSKKILMTIFFISLASFFLSKIFYCIYLMHIEKKNQNEENKKHNQNINTEIIYRNNLPNRNEEINSSLVTEDLAIINFNQSFPKYKNQLDKITIKGIDIKKKKYKNNKEIYPTKICTLCGYIYFRKEFKNKKNCFCYNYTDK